MYSVVVLMAMSNGAEVPDTCFRDRCNGRSSRCASSCSSSCNGRERGWRRSCSGWRDRRSSRRCNGGCTVTYTYCPPACTDGKKMKSAGDKKKKGKKDDDDDDDDDDKKKKGKKDDDKDKKKGDDKKKDADKKGTFLEAPATVIVNLPADATLLIDGHKTTSTDARRVLQSPALPRGQIFYYTLQASVLRNGKTEQVTQRISVEAGRTTNVTLLVPTASGVASR